MAKKKTSRTGRSTNGKSAASRKRTKTAASTGNGASASKSKKKTAGRSRTAAAGGKKATSKKASAKKAGTRKAAGKKASSKKATGKKAVTRKATTAKAGVSKKTTKKAGSGSGSTKKPAVKSSSKSPLTKKELEKYQQFLLMKRAEILGDMSSMSEEALGSDSSNLSHMPIHMADVSSDGYERELMLGLVESERQVIREIDEALQRIAEGTYGICEATGKPIAKSRLNVKPWAKYCIEAAREMERQNGSSRH